GVALGRTRPTSSSRTRRVRRESIRLAPCVESCVPNSQPLPARAGGARNSATGGRESGGRSCGPGGWGKGERQVVVAGASVSEDRKPRAGCFHSHSHQPLPLRGGLRPPRDRGADRLENFHQPLDVLATV